MRTRTIGSSLLIFIAIIILILASLMLFMKLNNDRIVRQNESYLADATSLSADHVNDRLESALNNIQTIAAFTSAYLDSPEVNVAEIQALELHNRFDYLQFLPASGILVTDSGETLDVTGRKGYINGMQGISGVNTIPLHDNPEERLFSFYTPVYFEGEVIGVLCGMYGEESMQRVISGEFFGVTAKTYLCLGDGTVITSFGDPHPPENILEFVEASDEIYGATQETILRAFQEHTSQSFNYQNSYGTENACIAALEYNDWMLVNSFPSEITTDMSAKANLAGVVLVSGIFLAAMTYIIFLIIVKRRREQSLIKENKEISQIVESVTALFSRFAVVDLKNDAYYYVAKIDGMPPEGKYSDLIRYVSQFYIDEPGFVKMSEAITPEHIQAHMPEDVEYLQYDYHINRGQDKWENVSLICLKRENGKPVSILYAVQNITKRRLKEIESNEALQNAFDAAKAANQAKSEFLSRMSHDIRTPMNAVMGMTSVAQMHMDDKERLKDCLNKITTSSRHLLALINDILDMSKIESGKVTLSEEPFSLAEMMDSILTIMHPQIKAKDQTISMSISKIEHEDVIGDTLRLRQVFVNIMGNAVKFTPEGGSISLDIRELESRIAGKACYEFVFTDTGIGMEQSYLEHIFEPFSRSSNPDAGKIEGTGLGMPIAQNIVSMMDGNIKVESELGKGSRFTVRLHLTIQKLDETDARCLNQLKILVADDDKDAAENAREILNSIGMNAVSVYGGEEAVAEVMRQHENDNGFAAVILDWKMPHLNGIQTAAKIREQIGNQVPIIILSAYDWTDIEQEARDTGVNAFIAKPLFRSRLVYVLKSLIAPAEEPGNAAVDDFTENTYSGKRILLVDDNELNREIAIELLTMIGLEVETAVDGKDAFEQITGKPAHYFDLVFMDIQMPRMNGYEATRAIRSFDRDDLKEIPIVAMSADAFSDDVFKAKESGMNDHISKPIEIPRLSEALSKWLGGN